MGVRHGLLMGVENSSKDKCYLAESLPQAAGRRGREGLNARGRCRHFSLVSVAASVSGFGEVLGAAIGSRATAGDGGKLERRLSCGLRERNTVDMAKSVVDSLERTQRWTVCESGTRFPCAHIDCADVRSTCIRMCGGGVLPDTT